MVFNLTQCKLQQQQQNVTLVCHSILQHPHVMRQTTKSNNICKADVDLHNATTHMMCTDITNHMTSSHMTPKAPMEFLESLDDEIVEL